MTEPDVPQFLARGPFAHGRLATRVRQVNIQLRLAARRALRRLHFQMLLLAGVAVLKRYVIIVVGSVALVAVEPHVYEVGDGVLRLKQIAGMSLVHALSRGVLQILLRR